MSSPSPFKEYFVGIDVSKLHFDASVIMVTDYHLKSEARSKRFNMDKKGLCAFFKWLTKQDATYQNTYVLMENTGLYHRPLWQFLTVGQPAGSPFRVHIGNAARIKWSLGLTRGKDDKTDALRLCQYALKEVKDLRLSEAPCGALLELKDLETIRKGFLTDAAGHRVRLGELEATTSKESLKTIAASINAVVKVLEKEISKIEARMAALLEATPEIKENYRLLLSVPGIGPVTARYLICCTSNFAFAPTGKQLACYAGLAPFSNTSGSSIRGKAKVHKMANKDLKCLLHMGARSVVRTDAFYKDYYVRKKAEGKHDLVVLNAVKAKILHRVAAVIRDQKAYEAPSKIAA